MPEFLSILFLAFIVLGGLSLLVSLVMLNMLGPRRRLPVPPGSVRACANCGYDFAGLRPGPNCPECGVIAGYAHEPRHAWAAIIFTAMVFLLLSIAALFVIVPDLLAELATPAFLFVASLFAGPYVVAAAGLLLVRRKLPWRVAAALTAAACTPALLVFLLLTMDAFRWSPDPQGGLVMITFPVVGIAAVGWGLPATVVWVKRNAQ